MTLFHFPFPSINGLYFRKNRSTGNEMFVKELNNDLLGLFFVTAGPKNVNHPLPLVDEEVKGEKLTEEVGFEPTVGCPTAVFKTAAIGHSATLP